MNLHLSKYAPHRWAPPASVLYAIVFELRKSLRARNFELNKN